MQPLADALAHLAGTGGSDIGAFLNSTYQAADSIRWILEKNGLDIAQFHALLDFGCGCGRVIRRWQALTGVEIHGVDYNPDLIEWCRAHLTFAHFQVNLLEPPLAYADSSFDFIYALSVFTHLPEELQQAWMAELTRVLRPGGYLLLSLHGDYYLPQLTSAERERYHDGKWVVKYEQVAGTNLCAAFCSSAYVKQSLARGVEVIDFVPQGATGNPHQDAYLLRKPGAGSA